MKMGEQVKKSFGSVKEYWKKQPPKRQKLILICALGVLVFAAVSTLLLNMAGSSYQVLYKGMDRAESTEVYSVLQEMEVPVEMNEQGEVLVKKEMADDLRLELATKHYPKTTLSYDIFNSSNGLTTTEFEKKQLLVQQLQNRLQDTLMRMDGIKNAVVTLDVAQESNYVWEETVSTSSAGVLLNLEPGVELSRKQVSGIKYLVSASVPKMDIADVKVIDAGTSLELRSADETLDGIDYELERLGFEEQIEKRMEEKVLKQLSLAYGPDEIRVSATVVLDYKKMISESTEYKPEEGNAGVIDRLDETYAKDATNYAQGIVGEENNTDIPVIVDQDQDGTPEVVDHTRSIDYAVSYIKQQVEKDQAELVSSTLAIMVVDPTLDQQRKDAIIEQASKAANVPVTSISLENVSFETPDVPVNTEPTFALTTPMIIGLGVLLIMLILIIVLVVIGMRRSKARKEQEEQEQLDNINIQQEIEERKRVLKETAEAKSTKENAITNEIRDFAKSNPEITASLIRAWLKEDE